MFICFHVKYKSIVCLIYVFIIFNFINLIDAVDNGIHNYNVNYYSFINIGKILNMAASNKRKGTANSKTDKKIKLNNTVDNDVDSDLVVETNDKNIDRIVESDTDEFENGNNIVKTNNKKTESKKLKTLEQLINYKRNEERTQVVISKNQVPLFAKKEIFRNTVKSPINSRNFFNKDNSELRTYILKKWDLLPKDLQELIEKEAVEHVKIDHTIKYDDLTAEEAFKLVFEDDTGVMVGFETIGHIAHLNIPNERLAVKQLIAKIILDKHKHIKTVINKRSELQNQFRTMDMEHLAGERNYVARLVENGMKFQIDFANVYWNSRLIQERNRIRNLLNSDDTLVDLFAGVGPFCIYAAKKGCTVLANDLNPVGVMYMDININLNKVSDLVRVYNQDARDFILNVIKKNRILDKTVDKFDKLEFKSDTIHFIMNLPRMAIEFLDVFVGLANNMRTAPLKKCFVHCYCFSTESNYEKEIDDRITRAMGIKLEKYKITKVRNIAPSKQMYCIEFECPEHILRLNKYSINHKTV